MNTIITLARCPLCGFELSQTQPLRCVRPGCGVKLARLDDGRLGVVARRDEGLATLEELVRALVVVRSLGAHREMFAWNPGRVPQPRRSLSRSLGSVGS